MIEFKSLVLIMDIPNGCMYQTPDRPDLVEYVKISFDE